MCKFDDVWDRLLPEAIALRASGSCTPQQICRRLAWIGFEDREKYNAMKNWYKRTFKDWPDKEDETKSTDIRRQSGMQSPPKADHPPQKCSQYSQIYPQDKQYYGTQQASDVVQRQWPNSLSQQGYRPPQSQIQNVIMPTPAQPGLYEYQAASQSASRQGALQNQGNSTAVHVSPRQFLPPHQYLDPQYLSHGDVPQSSVQGFTSSYQQVHFEPSQNSRPQQPLQVNEGGSPKRHDPLPQAGMPFGNEIYHGDRNSVIGVNAENSANIHELSLKSGYLNNIQNMDFDAGIDKFDERVNLPSGVQIPTTGTIAAPGEPVMASGFSLFPVPPIFNYHRAPHLASGPPVTSPRNHGTFISTGHQHIGGPFAQQYGPAYPSANPYRSGSFFPQPTMPPQHPLPPDPPRISTVICRRVNQPWRPIHMKPPTVRKPLSNQPINPEHTLIHSNLRDSSYISNLDYALEESLRLSFSSFKLTDEPNFRADYTESDDGSGTESQNKIAHEVELYSKDGGT